MDERVEIIDVPQPLQPHPGIGKPQGKRKLTWGVASLLCVVAAMASFTLGPATGLGYAFTSKGQALVFGWIGIIFIIAAILCNLISWAITEPDVQPGSKLVGYVSLSAAILLIMGIIMTRLIATI